MYLLHKLADVPAIPWANGAGVTSEFVSFEYSKKLTSEVGCDWRLSVARLDGPATFSSLPGVARTFMLLDGSATLLVNGWRHELDSGTPLQFSGDDEVVVDRLPAPCRALNIMVRGAHAARIVARHEVGELSAQVRAAVAVVDAAGSREIAAASEEPLRNDVRETGAADKEVVVGVRESAHPSCESVHTGPSFDADYFVIVN